MIEPVGDEGGFAKPGRSADEGKFGAAAVEPLEEVGPVDGGVVFGWWMEFGL